MENQRLYTSRSASSIEDISQGNESDRGMHSCALHKSFLPATAGERIKDVERSTCSHVDGGMDVERIEHS